MRDLDHLRETAKYIGGQTQDMSFFRRIFRRFLKVDQFGTSELMDAINRVQAAIQHLTKIKWTPGQK
jgi:hypothetical protein